jgi:predicted Zn-dependent protease
MNKGDLAVEKNDMKLAMVEYNAAMKMFPDNLEMKYWTAVTLANTGEIEKSFPMFKEIFAKDKNWNELTKRLPAVGLLNVSNEILKKILAQ